MEGMQSAAAQASSEFIAKLDEAADAAAKLQKESALLVGQDNAEDAAQAKAALGQNVKNPKAKKAAKNDLKKRAADVKQMQRTQGKDGEMPEDAKQTAGKWQAKTKGELKQKSLLSLREKLKPDEDSPEEVLKAVGVWYKDASVADEALDALLELSKGTPLADTIKNAKEIHTEQNGLDIRRGRAIAALVRDVAERAGEAPESLRDLYNSYVEKATETLVLFDELQSGYQTKDRETIMSFVLHSLGKDLKSIGSNPPRGLLHSLANCTRSFQGVKNVYREAGKALRLIDKRLAKEGITAN